LLIEIPELNIRFLRSNSFLPYDEYNLKNIYNLQIDYLFFPESYNLPGFINYEGGIPHLQYFLQITDNDILIAEKTVYVEMKKNHKWNFIRELEAFCETKLHILLRCSLQFILQSLNLERDLKILNGIKDEKNYLLPFGYEICSLSAYTYKLFKILYLNNEDIYCIQNELGVKTFNCSKIEYEWSTFQIYQNPQKNYLSAFNNPKGQKFFKECIPDLYSQIDKEAVFFNGCYFHGHFDNCQLNPKATKDTRGMQNKTYQQINEEFDKKLYSLIESNPEEVKKIHVHWECIFKNQKATPSYKRFLKNIFKPHPLIRLNPRSCVRGGFSDVYCLYWKENEHNDLHFLDINGLYSFCAINFPYFTGKYDILIGDSITDIKIKEFQFYFQSQPIYGSMLVTILPPKDLFMPFLLYRTKSGKVVNTLCAVCCETESKHCTHNDRQRALTACYFITEISLALKLGYKLLYIHECHFYRTQSYFLSKFVKQLNYLKVRFSNIFKNCGTDLEKQNYCDFLNKEMGLNNHSILTPHNCSNNKSQKELYKLMANSFFGKFQQKRRYVSTCFVQSQSQLEEKFLGEFKVQDIFCFNDQFCQLQIESKPKDIPDRLHNCYIGGQICAYAREIIYTYLTLIQNSHGKIFYVDTDAVIFSFPKNISLPVQISDAVGHFKSEIDGQITEFYSLGVKSYSITYQSKQQQLNLTKIKGLALNTIAFQKQVSPSTFRLFLENALMNQEKSVYLCQNRITKKYCKNEIKGSTVNITFRNRISSKRFFPNNCKNFVTYPYGYKV
jgi:hypothetical protein